MYKRKTASSIVKRATKRSKPRTAGPGIKYLQTKVRRGYTRQSGFYGRFPPVGDELKFFDTALAFTFDATGEVPATGQLVLIPQGTTESTRVGNKCVITSINLKGNLLFAPGAAVAAASTIAYMWLIQDTQANGAAAAITDVFTGTNASTVFRNIANSNRFIILKKFVWNFTSQAGATTAFAQVIKNFNYYKKCNIPLKYSSTSGAITELKSNNIFLITGSINSDDTITMDGNCRVRFNDSN